MRNTECLKQRHSYTTAVKPKASTQHQDIANKTSDPFFFAESLFGKDPNQAKDSPGRTHLLFICLTKNNFIWLYTYFKPIQEVFDLNIGSQNSTLYLFSWSFPFKPKPFYQRDLGHLPFTKPFTKHLRCFPFTKTV